MEKLNTFTGSAKTEGCVENCVTKGVLAGRSASKKTQHAKNPNSIIKAILVASAVVGIAGGFYVLASTSLSKPLCAEGFNNNPILGQCRESAEGFYNDLLLEQTLPVTIFQARVNSTEDKTVNVAPSQNSEMIASNQMEIHEKIETNKYNCSRVLKAKEQLLSCPEAFQLWNEVESEGPFSLECVPYKKAPFGAMVFCDLRKILVDEDGSINRLTSSILFELNNLKRAKSAILIDRNKCNSSADEFALAYETIEYGTASDTYKITDSCMRNGIWPKDLSDIGKYYKSKSFYDMVKEYFKDPSIDDDPYGDDWTSIEGYLKHQEFTGHTDSYRVAWYKRCNPAGLSKWLDQRLK